MSSILPTRAGACTIIVIMAAVGCAGGSTPSPQVIFLRSQSSAGTHGTATLTPLGSKTKIAIVLLHDPKGAEHPAHIHDGTCRRFVPLPRYPLNTVKSGTSVSLVNAPISELLGRGLVIEVHSSARQVQIIAACGKLEKGRG